jgi:cytochrome d ubiquinol oxidase subunit II
MFENMSYLALQQYWWIIISLLASFLVFLMFVQGGQTLIYTLGKTTIEKTMIVNALGRKWEFTFTTLVTFGGAFFASFPLFYATSFGGAYWVWITILFCFIIQAVAYEYRSKPNNFMGLKTYDTFLFINGAFGTILIGTAVGTFFNGAMFSVDEMNSSQWETPFRGLEAVLNWHNLALGLTVFFRARILGIFYIILNVDSEDIYKRSIKQLSYNSVPFLICFLAFLIRLLLKDGFAYDQLTGTVNMEEFKYLNNLISMPLVFIFLVAGIILVLFALYKGLFTNFKHSFYFAGAGTVLVVLTRFLIAGLNHTCYYPSVFDLQSSLNIQNSSSSHYTLMIMSYVSLLVPFVLAYIVYAWSAVNKVKIKESEMDKESHIY